MHLGSAAGGGVLYGRGIWEATMHSILARAASTQAVEGGTRTGNLRDLARADFYFTEEREVGAKSMTY